MNQRFFCVLLAASAVATAASAQQQFDLGGKRHYPPDGSRTFGAAAADFDGDGDTDLFVGSFGGTNRLLLNDGNGVFRPAKPWTSLPPGDRTQDLQAADIDGDGDFDVLVANDGANFLLVNGGGGRFVRSSLFPQGTANTEALNVADVDLDGDLDVVLANVGEPNQVLIQGARGRFTEQKRLPPEGVEATQRLLPVDVDGDGDPDLVVANFLAVDRLYINDGKGFFKDASAGRFPATKYATMDVTAVDVEQDGDLDLLVGFTISASRTLAGVGLYVNDGKGSFRDATAGRLPRVEGDVMQVAAADVDRDGNQDVVVAAQAVVPLSGSNPWRHRRNLVLLGDGKGSFRDAGTARFPAPFDQSRVAVAADFDGDGAPDLFFGNDRSPSHVYLNDGRGLMRRGTRAPIHLSAILPMTPQIFAADLDGDGAPDLIVRRRFPRAQPLQLFVNDGRGRFARVPRTRPPFDAGPIHAAITFLDADGDGDLDFLAFRSGRLSLFLNSGRATFTDATGRLPRITASDPEVAWLTTFDIERDGDLDILYADPMWKRMTLLVNDGRGSFTEDRTGRLPSVLSGRAAAGDLDGDGDDDLLLDDSVLLNDGKGKFRVKQGAVPRGLYLQATFLADLDRDGDLDALAKGSSYVQFTFLANDGQGNLIDRTQGRIPRSMSGVVAVRDFDLDGDPDALGREGRLFLDDGKGIFFEATSRRIPDAVRALSPSGRLPSLAVADVDRDGDPDVIFHPLGGPGEAMVLVNRHRQTEAPQLARIGRPYRIEHFSKPGYETRRQFVLPLASLGTADILVAPFGRLGLDPTRLVLFGPVLELSAATGSVAFAWHLPKSVSLVGRVLASQGLVLTDPARPATWRFTNAVADRIGL